MPRTARIPSRTNIYHVMLRGVNRQTIFEDNEDRHVFLTELQKCKEISGFTLYAFCLMPNHVHLLLKTNREPLEKVFRRLDTRYALWYNRRYERVGHLFQDRFRSENVEDERYFLTVLRYILQNPMKAGMERAPGTYRWSSYLAYEKGIGRITDIQYAVDLVGQREELVNYLRETNEDQAMDENQHISRLSDEHAKEMMKELTDCSSAADFQRLDDEVQKEYFARMYYQGMSERQISRLTGKQRRLIHRVIQQAVRPDPVDEFRANDGVLLEASPYEYIIW